MLASITPLGERSRRQRWPLTVSALIIGATAQEAPWGPGWARREGSRRSLRGQVSTFCSRSPRRRWFFELRPFGLRLPTHRRQVDEKWLHRYRGWVYGTGFGGQLGVGSLTIVATPAVYVALAAESLAPSIAAGLAIGATFGFVRGATVLSTARVDSAAALAAFHRGFHRGERRQRSSQWPPQRSSSCRPSLLCCEHPGGVRDLVGAPSRVGGVRLPTRRRRADHAHRELPAAPLGRRVRFAGDSRDARRRALPGADRVPSGRGPARAPGSSPTRRRARCARSSSARTPCCARLPASRACNGSFRRAAGRSASTSWPGATVTADSEPRVRCFRASRSTHGRER